MNVSFNVLHFVLGVHKGTYVFTNSLNSNSNHTSLIVPIQGFPTLQWGPLIPDQVVGKIGSS